MIENIGFKAQCPYFPGRQFMEQSISKSFINPVWASYHFILPRPKAHFGTGRNANVLKPDAPSFHAKSPDLGKLIRSTEDALSDSKIWTDDCIVVGRRELTVKRFAHPEEETGCLITIEEVDMLDLEIQSILMKRGGL